MSAGLDGRRTWAAQNDVHGTAMRRERWRIETLWAVTMLMQRGLGHGLAWYGPCPTAAEARVGSRAPSTHCFRSVAPEAEGSKVNEFEQGCKAGDTR